MASVCSFQLQTWTLPMPWAMKERGGEPTGAPPPPGCRHRRCCWTGASRHQQQAAGCSSVLREDSVQPGASRHFSRLATWPPTAWTSDLRCCRAPTPRMWPPQLPRTCRIQAPEVNTLTHNTTHSPAACMLNHFQGVSSLCVNKNCSKARASLGNQSAADRKVELALWELEQWVREEGPTTTPSSFFLGEKSSHHDSPGPVVF